MTELKTRFATEADAEAISALVNAAFKVERFFIDGDRIAPEKVREMMRRGKFMLAEDGGAMIACVYVELRGQRAYFGLLAVDPSRQGQGLGRKMVEEAEDYARGGRLRIHGFADRQFARGTAAILSAPGICRNGHRAIRGGRQAEPAVPFHKDVETARNCSRGGKFLDRQTDSGRMNSAGYIL